MKIVEIQDHYKEALAYHEIFRTLGIEPDNIRIKISNKKLCVFVNSEDKAIGFVCADLDINEYQLAEEWSEVTDAWNNQLSESQCREIYLCSMAYNNRMKIVAGLVTSGVY